MKMTPAPTPEEAPLLIRRELQGGRAPPLAVILARIMPYGGALPGSAPCGAYRKAYVCACFFHSRFAPKTAASGITAVPVFGIGVSRRCHLQNWEIKRKILIIQRF